MQFRGNTFSISMPRTQMRSLQAETAFCKRNSNDRWKKQNPSVHKNLPERQKGGRGDTKIESLASMTWKNAEYILYTPLLIFNAFCRIDKSAELCYAVLCSLRTHNGIFPAHIISITITNRPIWMFVYFMRLIWIVESLICKMILWCVGISHFFVLFRVNEVHPQIHLIFGCASESRLKSNQVDN